jgi:xylulokinase
MPGEMQTTIGTAGILATALTEPTRNPDGRAQVFCNVLPGRWHAMGVSLNAGGTMSWLRDVLSEMLASKPNFADIVALAEKSSPGANGLIFLPYLNGERCPHPSPEARGAFVGLTARHGVGDIARSVMEGVVYALYDIHELLRGVGISGTVIKASGGGVRSELWQQIQADLFDCEVVITEGAAGGAALGAALIAGVGVGIWPELGTLPKPRELSRRHPAARSGDIYREGYGIYADLYQTMQNSFERLGQFELRHAS